MNSQPDDTFEVTCSYDAPGMPDGDHTAEFLEAGTTFSMTGAMQSTPIPVERAYVFNERLYMSGHATFSQ
jgi:hypothetical protein